MPTPPPTTHTRASASTLRARHEPTPLASSARRRSSARRGASTSSARAARAAASTSPRPARGPALALLQDAVVLCAAGTEVVLVLGLLLMGGASTGTALAVAGIVAAALATAGITLLVRRRTAGTAIPPWRIAAAAIVLGTTLAWLPAGLALAAGA